MKSTPTIVLKFGSSVLANEKSVPGVVHEIYRWYRRGYRVVAVVSAIGRTTDGLIAQARAYVDEPDPEHLASLLATGELVSSSLVALALDRAGVPACVFDPARLGLQVEGTPLDAEPRGASREVIEGALARTPVAVVPGFFGRLPSGSIGLLGRGGSDLSALLLAHELGARCRLVKDVDGLYEFDPASPVDGPRPRKYEVISWDDALGIDGRIVQHKAVRYARSLGLSFEVGAAQSDEITLVGRGPSRFIAPSVKRVTRPLRVGLLGLGTVGLGVYRELGAQPERFIVTGIAVRRRERHLGDAPVSLITEDPWSVVEGENDVVVEAIGGRFPAFDLLSAAVNAGKDVVTANKAVIAHDGARLQVLAERTGARVVYSASVGGGAPFLEAVARLAQTPGIRAVEGVVNGTTSFVLDRLAAGDSLGAAVGAAQAAGFAEADPTADLDGTDAAHKLAILAREAFGAEVAPEEVDRSGIETLDGARVHGAAASGCVLRLVARARRRDHGASLSVRPEALPLDHPLADTKGERNRLLIHTTDGGTHLIGGRGAGRWPTTEAVLADLLDLWRTGRVRASVDLPARAREVAVGA